LVREGEGSSARQEEGAMNILILAPLVPYPPHDGDKLRLLHFMKHLRSKGHVLDLFGVTRVEADLRHAEALKSLCRKVVLERVTDLDLLLNFLGGTLLGRSLNVSSHFSPALRDVLQQHWLTPEGRSTDVVLAHRLRMAPTAFEGNPGKPVVLDLTDCLASYSRQARDQAGFPLFRRLAAWWDHGFLRREEAEWGEEAAKTLVISGADADALREDRTGGDRIEVVPNGVEVPRRGKRPTVYGKGRPVVCFLGNMGYPANEDGALWFLKKVWPRVREASPKALFVAVGGSPRAALRKHQNGDDILVTGFVPDTAPYLGHADVSVAPLRVAAGMQNKVVQSLAMGVPMVATPQALSWAPEEVRDQVAVAQDADRFAQGIVGALRDPRKARAQALRGRKAVLGLYRWTTSGAKLERILKEVARGRK
jgi:polysaccharide biosynthesis protein PslH